MQELMLRITNPEDRLIDDQDILFYKRDHLLQNKNLYYFYITTDFATSEARSADFSGISVWAVNSKNHRFWVDGILRRQTMDQNIDDLFRLALKYDPMSVGIEVNGQQGGFIPWIKQEQHERNIYFNIARRLTNDGKNTGPIGILSPTDKNKLQRFNIVLPLFKQQKVWLPEEMKESEIMLEAVKELKSVTKRGIVSRYDDWLDTVAQMGLMDIWTPSGDGEEKIIDEEDAAYNKYWNFPEPEKEKTSSYYV